MNTTAYRCKIVCIVLLFTILQVSCKKEVVNPNPRTPQPSEPRSSAELVKDGVYLYYKRYSLWADLSIPSYDPISQFTDKFNDPYSLLEALKSLTPVYVGDKYNGHIDRFSYMYDIESSGSERASLKMDTNYGFGMQFSWGVVDGEPAYPILDMVEGGSPAALAGLKRSDIILEINEEKDFSVPVTCTGTNCAPLNKSRFDQLNAFLRSAINSPSAMRIKYKTQEGVVAEKHLNYSYVYDIDPVLKTKVITSAGKGVGYFAFSSFEDIPEGGVNRQKIDDAFASFAEKGVQDIIIDLRYNGGGVCKYSCVFG
ncbi:S41 family peptidase [Sphingobacterium sp. Mn56C]